MKKLLFISLSGRIIKDYDGNLYLNSHMNANIISRYSSISDNLTLLLRDNCQTLDKSIAKKKFNAIPADINVVSCTNPYKPITNIVNPMVKKKIRNRIESYILSADKIIIAQATGIYANIAIKLCKKYRKMYLVIVGGFSFECDWYNGIKGKIVAYYREWICKKNIYSADYVLYVTEKVLQSRYPTQGRFLGCSDVEIGSIDSETIKRRKLKYSQEIKEITIGTMAQLDVKLKGVKYVIESLAQIKGESKVKFKYEIVGNGDDSYLQGIIDKNNLKEYVFIVGSLSHNDVYSWLDSVDIYIQPSFTEGLSRAILEAMSRGCPVASTDVGGNTELVSDKYLFKPGNVNEVSRVLLQLMDRKELKSASSFSLEKAKKYIDTDLNIKRKRFLEEFMNYE